MIKANNIYKSYGDQQVLQDVSLELKAGEITVLLGPSGCGKTTLLRNLSLLDFPDRGIINIFDNNYIFPCKNCKKQTHPFPRLTIVFQQLFLWPNLRNRENIMLALDRKNDFGEKESQLNFLIKEMEMQSYIDKFPNDSSLGQKQRVAIARALILNPEFIFFDEITASLDVLQIKKIIEIILNLRGLDTGVLFVTHNTDVAKKIADKIVFMQDGKIIETGGKDILLAPKTKELHSFLSL